MGRLQGWGEDSGCWGEDCGGRERTAAVGWEGCGGGEKTVGAVGEDWEDGGKNSGCGRGERTAAAGWWGEDNYCVGGGQRLLGGEDSSWGVCGGAVHPFPPPLHRHSCAPSSPRRRSSSSLHCCTSTGMGPQCTSSASTCASSTGTAASSCCSVSPSGAAMSAWRALPSDQQDLPAGGRLRGSWELCAARGMAGVWGCVW